MRLGKKIKTNKQWNATKEAVMEGTIENKGVQVKLFQGKIRSAKQSTMWQPPAMTNGDPVWIGQCPSKQNKTNGLVRTPWEQ